MKYIAIIGGGPGGLSLARLLQLGDNDNKRYSIKVYERDVNAQVRISGGSLDLHVDSGQVCIDKAQLRSEYETISRVEGGYYAMYTQELEQVWDLSVPQHPETDRNDLRTMLLNSLKPETVEWDCHLIKMEKHGEGYHLYFNNKQEPVYCDAVIGADGAFSKVRGMITTRPEMIKPKYSGVVLIQGELDRPEDQCPKILKRVNGGNMFALGSKGRHFGFQQKSDGSLIYYASFKAAEEDWMKKRYGIKDAADQQGLRNALLDIYQGFDSEIIDAIKVTDRFADRKVTGLMYRSTLNSRWNDFGKDRPMVTLIGDAAHVMPSFGGVGVNNAMMDAVELAEEVLNKDDLACAFTAYEQRMIDRCIPEAQSTEKFEDAFHAQDNVAALTKGFMQLAPIKLDAKWSYLLD